LFFIILLTGTIYSHAFAQENSEEAAPKISEVTYSEIRKLIDDGVVESARVTGDGWWVHVKTSDGANYYAQTTPQTPIADHLYRAGVPVKIVHWKEEKDERPLWLEIFYNLLPLLIFIVFFIFFFGSCKGETRKYRMTALAGPKR